MTPIWMAPGRQVKTFSIWRKSAKVGNTGRVSYGGKPQKIGSLKGIITDATQENREKWQQLGHPITHTILIRGRTDARPEDVLEISGRAFTVHGLEDFGGLRIFTQLSCEERFGGFHASISD